MKKINPYFILVLFFILNVLGINVIASENQVCDSDELLGLMVERGYLDLVDSNICMNLDEFPNVKMNLEEANYDLNGVSKSGGSTKQDKAVAKVAQLFNEVMPSGKTMSVKTRGYADGTRMSSDNYNDQIKKELFPDGKMTFKNLENQMLASDRNGYLKIKEYANEKFSGFSTGIGISYEAFLTDQRLQSLIRNFYLARARGENICNLLFNDPSKCQNEGEISPNLDKGNTCFDGCCDGRRGAVVSLTLPQDTKEKKVPSGVWQPPFKSPTREFQGKLQLAASLSIFSYPLNIEKDVENAIKENQFNDLVVERDRKVFKDALTGSGCEKNLFTVDSIRKIYWESKKLLPLVSLELKEAVEKNNFNAVLEIYNQKNRSNVNDDVLFKVLFSGASDNQSVKPISSCPKLLTVPKGEKTLLKNTFREFKKCKLVIDGDNSFFKEMNSVYDLLHSDKLTSDDFKILMSNEKYGAGKFIVFDSKKNISYPFSYDSSCGEYLLNKKPYMLGKVEQWNKTDKDNKAYSNQCLNSYLRNVPRFLNRKFFPEASTVTGVTPTDGLNCLNASKAYEHELADKSAGESIDISIAAQKMQKPFCDVAQKNQLELAHDPLNMTKHASGHGFLCGACQSGIAYEPKTKKYVYKARSDGTTIDSENDVMSFIDSGKNVKDLTIGAAKHLRSYLIPNCGKSCEDACSCLREAGLQEKIKNEGIVYNFTDDPIGVRKKVLEYQGDKEGSYACLFTPPVPHTCSFNPYGENLELQNEKENEEPTICRLKEVLLKKQVIRSRPTTSELKVYFAKCNTSSFPQLESQCLSSNNNLCSQIKKVKGCSSKPAVNKSGANSVTK